MAKGFPRRKRSSTVALDVSRLRNVPLVGIGAFVSRNTKKDDDTGESYEVEQIKLSLDWDSGYPQRDENGELVTDDEGHGRPHLINDGFVTLSGHAKANFVKILKAIGFGREYFDKKGNLRDDIAETMEVEFGFNKLDDAPKDWDELPEYVLRSDGGEHSKREVEVPIHSLKIDGHELLGRVVDLAIEVSSDGYNRIESYLKSEDFVDLATPIEPTPSMSLGGVSPSAAKTAAKAKGNTKAKAKANGMGKTRKGVPQDEVETAAVFGDSIDPENEPTPFEPTPTTKRAIYVTRALQTAGIPGKDRVAFLAWMLQDEDVTSVAEISLGAAQQFRAMAEGPDANGDSGAYIRHQFTEYQSRIRNAHLQQDEGDDDFDEDDDFDGDF